MSRNRSRQIALVVMVVFGWERRAPAEQGVPGPPSRLHSVELALRPGVPAVLTVPAPLEPRIRSVLISLSDPGSIDPGLSIAARVEPLGPDAAARLTLTKSLNCGDPDVVWSIGQLRESALRITITQSPQTEPAAAKPLRAAVRVADLAGETTTESEVAFEAEPNDTPETANRLTLGQTVYGLADDRPYLIVGHRDHRQRAGRRRGLVHV